jgi:glycine cleavage system H protein
MTTRYTTDHEYVRTEGRIGTVGISSYAQEQLGDIVFVESVKAASEIYAPVSGTVTEINEALSDEPGLINSGAEAGGWIFKLELSDETELDGLLDEAGYAEHTA